MNDCIQTIQIVFVDASRSKNKLISSFLFVCEIILDTFLFLSLCFCVLHALQLSSK